MKNISFYFNVIGSIGLMSILFLASLALASTVPQLVNYQGYLTNSTGSPVEGEVQMTFALYNSPEGLDPLWDESHSAVAVSAGVYSVLLGSVDPSGNPLLPLYFEQALWLGVTVGTDEEMTPRQELASVPFAMKAEDADTLDGQHGAYYLNWANMTGVPAGFADGIDDNTDTQLSEAQVDAYVADNGYLTGYDETDPTVPSNVKDGVSWSELSGVPTGFADGVDDDTDTQLSEAEVDAYVANNGYLTGYEETDPTVVPSVKDGVSWSEILGIPAGFADEIDNDTNTTYTAGTGLDLIGTQFRVEVPLLLSGSTSASIITGENSSTTGTAVYGEATASSGPTIGVLGRSYSPDVGTGVAGIATATTGATRGVYGKTSSPHDDSTGVYGYSSEISGQTYGVWGKNESESRGATGVFGESTAIFGETRGVWGRNSSDDGEGVYGLATSTIGSTYGVRGVCLSSYSGSAGVYGEAGGFTGKTKGVYGYAQSPEGMAIYGFASDYSGDNYGVYAQSLSTSGTGVYGLAKAEGGENYGVHGQSDSTSGRGVFGQSPKYGGYFEATGFKGRAVYGHVTGDNSIGVYGLAEGVNSSGVWADGVLWDVYAANSQYGPFTGGHEVKLSDDFPIDIQPGMIVSITGEAQARKDDSNIHISSTLPTVKLSQASHDKTVFGVFVKEASLPEEHWHEIREGERFATVNALGEGRVWVTNMNGNIEAGDYITTSSVPGFGQRQNDDLLHSYTLGKAIETVDWDTIAETVENNGQLYKACLIAVVYTSG